MTLSALPDYLPPPSWDFLADPEKHELSLTVRLSRGQIPTNLGKLENYSNYDFSCPTSLPWQPFHPSPWDNLTDPDKHELSLTVRFSHDKIFYTTIINLDFVCCTWLPPLPLPWDFLADPEKDELSLTVRLSRGQNLINLEKLDLSFTFIIV